MQQAQNTYFSSGSYEFTLQNEGLIFLNILLGQQRLLSGIGRIETEILWGLCFFDAVFLAQEKTNQERQPK